MRWCVCAKVVDNWGDIGFAWRLVRALQALGEEARLVVDDAGALAWMAPGRGDEPRVATWPGRRAPTDIAVETFGCGFPEGLRAGVFINVEHLTAEPFAARSHGLPSPAGGRTVWFFFPGFEAATGGVLGPPIARPESSARPGERVVTAFGYASDAWSGLVDALVADARSTRILALPGGATDGLRRVLGPGLARGAVRVEPMAFRSQDGYDALLASADLNLVRGEDSLVRAVRAGRPFLWQAYVQADGAHVAKVRAFVGRYGRDAEPALADALQAAFARWNGFGPPGAALALPPADAWTRHAASFADALAATPTSRNGSSTSHR
jgi:uncharacterized repeat protein (TIGR03837 family)